MALGDNHLEGLVVERLHLDARHIEGQCDDGRVDRAVFQVVGEKGCHRFLDIEMGIRRDLAHCADQFGQQIGADGVNHAETEVAVQRIPAQLGHLLDAARFIERPPCLRHHLPAKISEGDVALAALDQADAEFVFQILERNAQGGLADMAFFCRLAERAFVGKGHQITQGREFHGWVYRSPLYGE